MRYFRASNDDVYEQARATLDAAWGHVAPITCIDPAAVAPRDASGMIVLAVNDEFCEYPAAAQMLAYVLAGGAVAEITRGEYQAAVNPA